MNIAADPRPIISGREAVDRYRAMSRRGGSRSSRRTPPKPPASAGITNPTSIANSVLWLRADLGVTIGTGVATWADQSGHSPANDFTQATGTKQPTRNASGLNSKPTIAFASASAQSLVNTTSTTLQPTAGVTVWIVWRWTATTPSFAAVFTTASSSAWSDGWGMTNGPAGTAGQVEFFVNLYNGHETDFTYNNTTWRATTAVYDQTSVTMYTDGASVGTPAAYTAAISYVGTTTTIGADPIGDNANVEIAEIAVYSRAINSTEIGQLHTYGVGRYALP